MAKLEIRREICSDEIRLRLGGSLDGRTARLLRQTLEALPRGRLVVLDFERVRPFSDIGIAVLAHEIRSLGRVYRIEGLSLHQQRLFRYFGVSLAPSQALEQEAAL
ncbi:MAG: STAS domain-containing protein [Myxococcales bacterium]